MKKILVIIVALLVVVSLLGCKNNNEEDNYTYQSISAEEAKKLMDTVDDYYILDVREKDEYEQGHIKNALLIPYQQIEVMACDILVDKQALILVYCRSGRRSKIAAQSLADMGYSNVKEFGGIIDWPYDIE